MLPPSLSRFELRRRRRLEECARLPRRLRKKNIVSLFLILCFLSLSLLAIMPRKIWTGSTLLQVRVSPLFVQQEKVAGLEATAARKAAAA